MSCQNINGSMDNEASQVTFRKGMAPGGPGGPGGPDDLPVSTMPVEEDLPVSTMPVEEDFPVSIMPVYDQATIDMCMWDETFNGLGAN